jgi:dihydroorotate dehydrogenase subfamily 1
MSQPDHRATIPENVESPQVPTKADMRVRAFGLEFSNPVIPAAGPNVRDGAALATCAEGGAGGLLAKTVSVRPAPVPRPNMALYARNGLINTELWTELSLEQWLDTEYDIGLSAARGAGVPFLASVGYTADEVREVGPKVAAKGVDAIEFSIHYVGHDFANVVDTARALRDAVSVPIIAKFSPHFGDLGELAALVEPYVDGFTCINSFGPTLRIDIERAEPVMGSRRGYGWISGEPIKPLALRCVFEVARRTSKPVVGVGGIATGEDLIEFFMAGASLVGVCTAAILQGNDIYGRIAHEASVWLDEHGHNSVADVRGLYLERFRDGQRVITEYEEAPALDEKACIRCARCGQVCWYGAIDSPPEQLPKIEAEPCFQCGLCVAVCPTAALSFKPRRGVTI